MEDRMEIKWYPTDKHVYGAIYREHYEEFSVFESFTAPEGSPEFGVMLPRIETSWGFKNSETPIIKSIATKESVDQKEYDYEYFIAIIVDDD